VTSQVYSNLNINYKAIIQFGYSIARLQINYRIYATTVTSLRHDKIKVSNNKNEGVTIACQCMGLKILSQFVDIMQISILF